MCGEDSGLHRRGSEEHHSGANWAGYGSADAPGQRSDAPVAMTGLQLYLSGLLIGLLIARPKGAIQKHDCRGRALSFAYLSSRVEAMACSVPVAWPKTAKGAAS